MTISWGKVHAQEASEYVDDPDELADIYVLLPDGRGASGYLPASGDSTFPLSVAALPPYSNDPWFRDMVLGGYRSNSDATFGYEPCVSYEELSSFNPFWGAAATYFEDSVSSVIAIDVAECSAVFLKAVSALDIYVWHPETSQYVLVWDVGHVMAARQILVREIFSDIVRQHLSPDAIIDYGWVADLIDVAWYDDSVLSDFYELNRHLLVLYDRSVLTKPIILYDSNEGMGGDGLVPVNFIDGDVEHTALEVVSLNDFRLCEVNPNVEDPWSPVACTSWNPTGRVAVLGGDYMFRAELETGARICGSFSVSGDWQTLHGETYTVPVSGGETCPR